MPCKVINQMSYELPKENKKLISCTLYLIQPKKKSDKIQGVGKNQRDIIPDARVLVSSLSIIQ